MSEFENPELPELSVVSESDGHVEERENEVSHHDVNRHEQETEKEKPKKGCGCSGCGCLLSILLLLSLAGGVGYIHFSGNTQNVMDWAEKTFNDGKEKLQKIVSPPTTTEEKKEAKTDDFEEALKKARERQMQRQQQSSVKTDEDPFKL